MAYVLDPAAITLIQNVFLKNIADKLDFIVDIAKNLLYLFTAFEFVMFGLVWALSRNAAWERIFFKIIKIGLIFFIITNYSYFLDIILRSFAQIGAQIGQNAQITDYLFNPAKLWQFGYDPSVELLQTAMRSSSIGLAITGTFLGLGILVIFGLLGIQIIVQYVGFYLVAITALIVLPLGVFNPTSTMFDRAMQAIIKAGVRIMMLIIELSIAISIWSVFNLEQASANLSINEILGLFFTSLIFLMLAHYLPKLAEKAVGNITSSPHESINSSATTVTTTGQSTITPVVAGASEISAVRAAAYIDSGASSGASASFQATATGAAVTPGAVSAAPAASVNASPTSSASGVSMGEKVDKISTAAAAAVGKDIAATVIKDLQKTITNSLNNDKNKK